jgi:hypothetical protein
MLEATDMAEFTDVDYGAIAKQNSENLDKTTNGGAISFGQRRDVIIIGDGHGAATRQWWDKNCRGAEWAEGQITVTKGKGMDPGSLSVTGLKGGYRNYFQTEVGKFSKKKIVFV